MALNVLGSNTPSIVNPVVFGLLPAVGPYSALYAPQDIAYDYAVGGIPFLSGESLRGTYFRRMYKREFSPIRKDQFDNLQVPGEQSLWGWWLRSQSLFTQGAGIQYLDTSQDQTIAMRYNYSEHLDMLSTPGSIGLLPATKSVLTSTNTNLLLRGVSSGGTDYILVADGAFLKRITIGGTVTSYTMPGGVTSIVTLTDDGTNYYFADTTGVWKGAISDTGTAATKSWPVPSASGSNVLNFVKGRLMGGLDNSVYELVGTGATLPTPKFTHNNASYVFTSIDDIPSAILAAGSAGATSSIHRFTLDTSGALPVLSGGSIGVDMPYGEQIKFMYSYVSTLVAIGTSKGLRVAQADQSGNLSYGPLIVQNTNGIKALSGFDRFIFCGNMNNASIPQPGFTNPTQASVNSMLTRVDLASQTSTAGYPYANDLDSHQQGQVNSCCNFGTSSSMWGVMAMSVSGQGVYITDTAKKEASGSLFTGKIRYNTLEAKHFKFLYMRTPPLSDGSIQAFALDPSGGYSSIFTQSNGTTTSPILIGTTGNQQEWLQLQFAFTRGSTDNNVTPVLNGYQLRALPGVDRQVVITVPLSCHDFESDKYNQETGYDGYSYSRIQALEALIASGNLVLFQDLAYGTSNLVIADDYSFEQQANEQPKASSAGAQDSNARGGYLTLRLRVIQ